MSDSASSAASTASRNFYKCDGWERVAHESDDDIHSRKSEEQRLMEALDTDPELLEKAVAVGYAHHLMFNGLAAQFISTYLDSDFRWVFKDHTLPCYRLFLLVSVMFAVITLLPVAYGELLMKDPCLVHPVKINEIEGRMEHLAEVGCKVQTFIKSWKALLLGPAASIIVVSFQSIGPVAAMAQLGLRRHAKRIKVFLYAWVHQDLWRLWYQPFNDDGRNLALICTIGMYACVLLEFLAISFLLKDGLALAVGLGLARLLLISANLLLAPTDKRIEMVKAELRGFQYPGCDASLGEMVARLHSNVSSSVFFVTKAQLDSFFNIPLLKQAVKMEEFLWSGDVHNDEKHGMHRMTVTDFETPIQFIYISDMNVFVPITSANSPSFLTQGPQGPLFVDFA